MSQTFTLKQAIEDAVIAGEFVPGDRLDEASLAERFGVSRTPIREALLQLGAEGFIEVRPRRGAIVSVPSAQRLIEAAHLACVDAAATGDPEIYYGVNRGFHEAIYRASRNTFLAEQALTLHKRLSAYRRVQLRARNRLGQSLAEHAGILEAIREGNEELAAKRLRDHVLVQGERFSDMMLNFAAATENRASQRSGR